MSENKNQDKEQSPNVPAYMRKRQIYSAARQKLILTALDRKEANLKPNSKRATARKKLGTAPRNVRNPVPAAKPYGSTYEDELIEEMDGPASQTTMEPDASKAPTADITSKPKKLALAGTVTHYLDKIDVAIIKLTKTLKQGDTILIEGKTYLALQPIDEMQIDRKPVKSARKGDHIGLKVKYKPEINGKVYKV